MNHLVDLTGQRFGRLTVIRKDKPYISPDGDIQQTKWLCRCDCGKEVRVIGKNMKIGATKSCGCLRKELASKRQKAAFEALRKLKEIEGENYGKPV